MTIRTTAIILGLASLAGGCTITTHHDGVRDYRQPRVVHEADAYEGYYYVRIVYLNGIPWYVDEDLRARPVPPHLRSHFRYASRSRSAPPSFGHDVALRDGYRLSRIVYINGVPHHVDEDRRARPIPSRLRHRFAYESVARPHDDGRRPSARSGTDVRPLPPAYGRQEAPTHRVSGGALGRVTERMREEARPLPPEQRREHYESTVHEADHDPRRGMPRQRMEEERGRIHEADHDPRREMPRQRMDDDSRRGVYEADHEPGRGMRRQRTDEDSRRGVYEADDEPGRGMPPARMREDSGRQAPPFAVRMQNEDLPSARAPGRDERRPMPQHAAGRDGDSVQRGGRGAPQDVAQGDRGQPRSAAVNGRGRSADDVPERNGKGKGNKKGQEADSEYERDDGGPKRKWRD